MLTKWSKLKTKISFKTLKRYSTLLVPYKNKKAFFIMEYLKCYKIQKTGQLGLMSSHRSACGRALHSSFGSTPWTSWTGRCTRLEGEQKTCHSQEVGRILVYRSIDAPVCWIIFFYILHGSESMYPASQEDQIKIFLSEPKKLIFKTFFPA